MGRPIGLGSGISVGSLVGQPTPVQFSSKGFIAHINDIPPRSSSHVDPQGRPITKQQLVEPFDIPNIAGFSVAALSLKQTMDVHAHESMVEFFYILSGVGSVIINGVETALSPGTFVQVVPGEYHGFQVAESETQDLRMILCGVATGLFRRLCRQAVRPPTK